MNVEIMSKNGALPCEVTMDDDNGIFTIRHDDTSGEVFELFFFKRMDPKSLA